jgi:NADPH:quinone reductase-like Zn-dependent oxidoreductase
MQVLTAPRNQPLAFTEVPDRPLRPDEVRVAVRAVGVNPVDWKMRDGEFLGVMQRIIGPPGPLVCGVDFAGDITAVGAAVTDRKVGERVVGGTDFSRRQHGSYARQVQVRADQVTPLPPGVDYPEAACLPVAGVTAQAAILRLGRVDQKPGARVLVLGAAGGVGHFAVQLARIHGATAVGVCSARNADLVRRLGAEPLDYGQGDVAQAAAALGPYDVVVDAVGTQRYPAAMCRKLLREGGRHVLVMPTALDFVGVILPGPTVTVLGKPDGAQLAPLVEHLAAGRLKVVIQQRFPLAEAEAAQQLSRGGKVVGKLVLVA